MAQTADAFAAIIAKIEFSTNGTAWTDISGFANFIKPGSASRTTGVRYTHDGENAILTAGKQGTIELSCQIIYTEGTADPFERLRTAFETAGGGDVYLRWQPKGTGVGNSIFTTDVGVLKKFDYPLTDAEDPKPEVCSFTIEVTKITKTVST